MIACGFLQPYATLPTTDTFSWHFVDGIFSQWSKCNRTSNFWSEALPHLKIPRDAGEREGGTHWYAINVHFKIHVAISVK